MNYLFVWHFLSISNSYFFIQSLTVSLIIPVIIVQYTYTHWHYTDYLKKTMHFDITIWLIRSKYFCFDAPRVKG